MNSFDSRLWKPIYSRKWGTGWISPVPEESHVLLLSSFLFHAESLCFFLPPLFSEWPHDRKGFKLCCPHFHKRKAAWTKDETENAKRCETMALRNAWQHNLSTCVTTKMPRPYWRTAVCRCYMRCRVFFFVCVCVCTHQHRLLSCVSTAAMEEKTEQNFLQDKYRSERRSNQLLYDSTSPSFASNFWTEKSWCWPGGWLLFMCSKEIKVVHCHLVRKTGRLTSNNSGQLLEDLPA